MTTMQDALKNWGAGGQWGGGPTVQIGGANKRLTNAVRSGDVDGVRAALKDGAEPGVQFRTALGEITPIFLCAQKGYLEIAELLTEYGADINKKMDFDHTLCLHHAASNDQPDMCTFLINKNCDVNSRDRLGRTPLMDAAEIGSIRTVTVLIENDADIHAEDKENFTALSYCIDFVNAREPRFYQTAQYLVDNDASVNAQGKFANRSILHCAAAQGDLDFVRTIVEEKKGRVLTMDSEGKTPIDYAKANGHDEVVSYLTEHQGSDGDDCACIIM